MAGGNLASAVMDTPETTSNPAVTITPDPPPVTLDFSKAQPINPPVTLDFSKAQPITITPDNHVLMIAPGGGEAAYVPQDQVASYEAKGGKIGIRMTAPDGKEKAIVPFDQQDQYQKQGGTWDVSPDNDAAKAFLTQRSASQASQNLSDQNRYMVSAMTGQGKDFSQDPTLTPQERQQAEAGRKAGTIQGGIDIAAGAGLGAAATGLEAIAAKAAPAAKMVATGLVDEMGNPIMRQQAVESVGKIPGILKSAYDWASANPVKAYLLFKVADEIGLGPKGLKQLFHIVSGSE